ncbi:MAG: hypothetical protein AAB493_01275 [Patescibacteria group bacterium]
MPKQKEKTKIEISDELRQRIEFFKEFIEAVIEEKMEFNDSVELILDKGINSMIEDILANVEPATLLLSFQQLGAKYPAEVYKYMAETLHLGSKINKEELKKTIGFRRD